MADLPLHPLELPRAATMVESRRREFSLGRAAARAALASLGIPDAPLPVSAHRDRKSTRLNSSH